MSASGALSGFGLVPLDVPVDIGADEARRRALEELAKAKYGGVPEWVGDYARRGFALLEWLVRQLSGLLPAPRSGGGVNWGFLAVVLILLVLIAVVIWRVGLPRWRGRGRTTEELDLDPARAAADYRTSADQFAAAGDWRAAVRDRYRGVVRELEVRTVIDPRPGRTAGEVAAAAGRLLPDCHDDLYAGADLFGGVNYGDQPADATTYAAMVSIDQRVTAAADRADLAAAEQQAVGSSR